MQESLSIVSGPTDPVTLAEAKAQMRVDITDDDALITAYITAARLWCEAYSKKTFATTTWAWQFDFFPNRLVINPATQVWDSWLNSRTYPYTQAQILQVPVPPLVSVTSIQYYDINGVQQTMSLSDYIVIPGNVGRITPKVGEMWPATQSRAGSVTVTFVAGESAVSENEKLAIKLLVAHWYRNREGVSETSFSEVPLGIKNLLNATKNSGYW